MKVSTGRGIQFFKRPIFAVPKNFAVNTYHQGKKTISGLINRNNKKK